MKYTKGEWTADQIDMHTSIKPWRVLQDTKIICKLDSYDRYNPEANIEEEANAKLIAAAPDMLEALIAVNGAQAWIDDALVKKQFEKVYKAIQKATE